MTITQTRADPPKPMSQRGQKPVATPKTKLMYAIAHFNSTVFPSDDWLPCGESLGQRPPFRFSAHPDDFSDEWTLDEVTHGMRPGVARCVRMTVWQVVAAMGYDIRDVFPIPGNYHGYRRAVGLPGGGQVRFDNSVGPENINVDLPDEAARACGKAGIRRLMRWVASPVGGSDKPRGRANRVDPLIDDYRKIVTPAELNEAYVEGCAVTHARVQGFNQKRRNGPRGPVEEVFTLGQDASRQMLEVSNKMNDEGEIEATRWLLRTKDEVADNLARELVERGDWGRVFSERLVSYVDFRRPDANKYNKEKRPRLPWFARLVGMARKASSYAARPVRTIQETARWVRRMACTIGAVREYMGASLFRRMLDWADDHRKPKHRALFARFWDERSQTDTVDEPVDYWDDWYYLEDWGES